MKLLKILLVAAMASGKRFARQADEGIVLRFKSRIKWIFAYKRQNESRYKFPTVTTMNMMTTMKMMAGMTTVTMTIMANMMTDTDTDTTNIMMDTITDTDMDMKTITTDTTITQPIPLQLLSF